MTEDQILNFLGLRIDVKTLAEDQMYDERDENKEQRLESRIEMITDKADEKTSNGMLREKYFTQTATHCDIILCDLDDLDDLKDRIWQYEKACRKRRLTFIHGSMRAASHLPHLHCNDEQQYKKSPAMNRGCVLHILRMCIQPVNDIKAFIERLAIDKKTRDLIHTAISN